jgi:hypothetical protein
LDLFCEACVFSSSEVLGVRDTVRLHFSHLIGRVRLRSGSEKATHGEIRSQVFNFSLGIFEGKSAFSQGFLDLFDTALSESLSFENLFHRLAPFVELISHSIFLLLEPPDALAHGSFLPFRYCTSIFKGVLQCSKFALQVLHLFAKILVIDFGSRRGTLEDGTRRKRSGGFLDLVLEGHDLVFKLIPLRICGAKTFFV